MIVNTTYGDGGLDTNKPNNNVIETIERIDDQHCVLKEYEGDTVVNEQTLDMPVTNDIDSTEYTIPGSALIDLSAALSDTQVNSITELKAAIANFVSNIK